MNLKRKLRLSLLVALLIFSILTVLYRIPSTANATYVEGPITQNTDWTVVDSPFIVSNDVTINPAATLTIEPGVQVRFGGNFSITVYGRLIADGTDTRNIIFTSNGLNPAAGDWNTINMSTAQPCSLTHCTIEYASDGVTLETGNLNLQNNLITQNINGTTINGGTVTIQNDQVTNNTINGISIAGNTHATVQTNLITQNGNGLTVTGNMTGSLDVTYNTITQNTNGILLNADVCDDTTISNNNIGQNEYGTLFATTADPNLNHNYIAGNTVVGVYYGNGTGHEIHYNDILQNAVGMDVSTTASVTATYNYWGDQTGPFHVTLNPNGKGNPVGGNGTNLIFIFFLTAPAEYNNSAPTAILLTDKTVVAPGEPVTFIGTMSTDDRQVDQYFYNFGDGTNSGWTTLSLFNHTYTTANTNYTATLTVKDDFNTTSQNSAAQTISVQNLTPLAVTMNLASETLDYEGNTTVTVNVTNRTNPVQNAYVTLLSLKGGVFSTASAFTDQNGQFQTNYTAPQVTDITNIRLIATATETGTYADGSAHANLEVLPLLNVQITNPPASIQSNSTLPLTFVVTGGMGQPVPDATVTAYADQGVFQANTEATDNNGTTILNYTAPATLNPLNATITSTAQATGYTNGQSQTTLAILPNTLSVQMTTENSTLLSQGTTNIDVQVTSESIPIPNATVTITSDNVGTITPTTATTDKNGIATFQFTAPRTTTALNATLTATATKDDYTDATAQATINVTPKLLAIQVTADKNPTTSETELTLTVTVAYNQVPVQYANVTIDAQNQGNLTQTTATTDNQGFAIFSYTAPRVDQPTNITITAQSTTGYADGQNTLRLTVNPGTINVQITPDTNTTLPGSTINLTVTATSNGNPLPDAQVTVSADAGTFAAATATTDQNGDCTFTYNAPPTQVQLPASITAQVVKNGYIQNSNQTTINIVPGNMTLQVIAYSYEVTAGKTSTITVTATSNGNPLPDAQVTVSADAGTFAAATATTDQNGDCTFTYNAPLTSGLVNVIANATKNGGFASSGFTVVKIVPTQQTLPFLTILLIIIPIIIVATVVALIKLKVIVVSTGGEGDSE